MDNWLTILLAFVFFVLPLLEGILKKSRKGGPTPGPHPGPAPSDGREDADFEMERFDLESADPPVGEQWSGGWGSWPSDEPEKEEPVRVWGSERGRKPVPERYEDVTYSTEDKPLQELAERLNRIAISEPETVASTSAEPSALPRPDAAALRIPGPSRSAERDRIRVAQLLRDPRGVRQAIVLSEVLGPPLASRY